jgi:cation transport ATPase
MIHLLLPLIAVGAISAVWRDYRQARTVALPLALSAPSTDKQTDYLPKSQTEEAFDDVGELYHYQRVSWYSLALAASGSWFYPPIALVSVPLLGYNAYHFTKIIKHTDAAGQKSPMTIFESIALTATLATGQVLSASLVFLFAFGSRKLLLQAGNIADVGFSRAIDPRFAKVWLLRGGAEIEATLSEVKEGDVIVVRGGEVLLMAGKVVEGEGVVRQYSLQKKAKSITKQIGDSVFPFTQMESGCLHVQRA